MSNYIRVNHSQFESTATAIESYLSKHKKNMAAAGQEVAALGQTWQGKDFTEFQHKWTKVTDNGSTSHAMITSLENYAKALRYAASQYKDAQAKAVNKANWL